MKDKTGNWEASLEAIIIIYVRDDDVLEIGVWALQICRRYKLSKS